MAPALIHYGQSMSSTESSVLARGRRTAAARRLAMVYLWLTLGVAICAIQAIRSPRLLASALWLAGASALVSIILYALGAREVAVIELSVGAGLVTVLLVYAIAIAGDDALGQRSPIPRLLALGLVSLIVLLLAWLALPMTGSPVTAAGSTFRQTLWQQRGIDVLAQIVLLFIGAIGVLGLVGGDERQATGDDRSSEAVVLESATEPGGRMVDTEAEPGVALVCAPTSMEPAEAEVAPEEVVI
jgi:uncharacterized MnhB-related membrane protein